MDEGISEWRLVLHLLWEEGVALLQDTTRRFLLLRGRKVFLLNERKTLLAFMVAFAIIVLSSKSLLAVFRLLYKFEFGCALVNFQILSIPSLRMISGPFWCTFQIPRVSFIGRNLFRRYEWIFFEEDIRRGLGKLLRYTPLSSRALHCFSLNLLKFAWADEFVSRRFLNGFLMDWFLLARENPAGRVRFLDLIRIVILDVIFELYFFAKHFYSFHFLRYLFYFF